MNFTTEDLKNAQFDQAINFALKSRYETVVIFSEPNSKPDACIVISCAKDARLVIYKELKEVVRKICDTHGIDSFIAELVFILGHSRPSLFRPYIYEGSASMRNSVLIHANAFEDLPLEFKYYRHFIQPIENMPQS